MTAPEKHHLRPPQAYLNAIRRSDQYLVERSRFASEPERRAIGATALNFVATQEAKVESDGGYLDLDVQAVRLIGLIDDYVTGQDALNDFKERGQRGERVPRDARRVEAGKVIRFNHALRELVDSNQHITTKHLEDFLGAASMELYHDEHERDNFIHELRFCMIGMQHEILAEQALWTIDGVEDVIHADAEDELRGVDLKVIYNGRGVNLDIKSSERTAEAGRRKAMMRGFDNSAIVWTGVATHELGGHFRGDNDTVAVARRHMKAALDQYEMPLTVAR